MKRLRKIDKADYKFVPANPDPDFSPEHNAQVIENSIKKYEAMRNKKIKEHNDTLVERAEAIGSYFKALNMGGKESDINKYFGNKQMAYLKGQKILNEFKERMRMSNAKAQS